MNPKTTVVWLMKSMGYDNNLLYWGPLLRSFVEEFPKTDLLTCDTEANIDETGHKIRKAIPYIGFKFGSRKVSVPSPLVIFALAKIRPELIVISEFGVLSLYAIIYKLFRAKVRVLLLVENEPAYLRHNGVNRNSILHKVIRSLIVGIADRVLCNNKKTAVYLSNELGAPSKKIICGCYLTSEVPSVSGARFPHQSGLVLLFVGRLIRSKGLVHLLRAIKMLGINDRRRLYLEIVGDGPERRAIEAEVVKMGIEGIVTIHGSQPYEKLGDFFSRADVFVFPTLGDYRALVGFEALSAGLPVIGSIFDGAGDEVVEIGVNGFLVDPRNEEELSEKIRYFLSDPVAVKAFGAASKRKAVKFSAKVAAANLVQACLACASDCAPVDEA
jgi:glycosyltransferase involved in cell wall biosynthesis